MFFTSFYCFALLSSSSTLPYLMNVDSHSPQYYLYLHVTALTLGNSWYQISFQICLAMNDIFIAIGGAYSASLLALRRCGLPTVNHLSADMEKLRAKIKKGGQELSIVDGKFLEDIREIVGRLEGTLSITLMMFWTMVNGLRSRNK